MAFDRQFGRGDIRPPEEHGEDPGEERDELLLDPAPAWDAVHKEWTAPWRQGLVNMAAARPRAWSAEPDFHADRGPDGQVLIIVINLDHTAYNVVKPAFAVLTGLRFSFS